MKPNDLDEISRREKEIEPSPWFTRSVMNRIESEAPQLRPISFPWVLVSAITLLVILAIWTSPEAAQAMNAVSYRAGQWLLSPPDATLRSAFLPAVWSVLGTFILIWLSLRLAGARR